MPLLGFSPGLALEMMGLRLGKTQQLNRTSDPVSSRLGRYNPLTKTVTVGSKGAVQVNFTLSRTDAKAEEGKTLVINPPDTRDPTTKEFETLIKDLSAEHGLEHLVLASSGDAPPYRYHPYKDLSEFLRGLNLNYPQITNLTRSVLGGTLQRNRFPKASRVCGIPAEQRAWEVRPSPPHPPAWAWSK